MSGYQDFSEYDFLCDDTFIEWMLAPSDESDAYWKSVAESSPRTAAAIDTARRLFRNSVRLSDYRQTDTAIEQCIAELSARIKLQNRIALRRRRLMGAIAGAACAAAFILALIFQPFQADNYILSVREVGDANGDPTDEVTLISHNQVVTIDNNSKVVLNDVLSTIAKSPDGQAGIDVETSVVHLIVPHERQTSIRLDDGSVIWINAGSRISFPEKFDPASRVISVDGEVYLSVARDASRPFTVTVGDQLQIKVLGTEFGITAYRDDDRKSVVLVSGSVEVCRSHADPVRLRPNQRMEIDGDNYRIGTVDVMEYVSWKNGWLYANGTNLGELMSKLSRYYGRTIVCTPEIANLTCSGKLLFSDDIEVILQVVCKNTGVKYLMTDNKILLYP